jgi:hypothetical protein
MKKIIAALALTLITTAAFAQHRPGPHRPGPRPGPHHRPAPRPMPGPYHRPMPRPIPRNVSCRVAMVDRFNRPVRTYWGTRDWRTGMCRDALRQCNFEQRRMGHWNLRCVQTY